MGRLCGMDCNGTPCVNVGTPGNIDYGKEPRETVRLTLEEMRDKLNDEDFKREMLSEQKPTLYPYE